VTTDDPSVASINKEFAQNGDPPKNLNPAKSQYLLLLFSDIFPSHPSNVQRVEPKTVVICHVKLNFP
jgi:hypothetical protein